VSTFTPSGAWNQSSGRWSLPPASELQIKLEVLERPIALVVFVDILVMYCLCEMEVKVIFLVDYFNRLVGEAIACSLTSFQGKQSTWFDCLFTQ